MTPLHEYLDLLGRPFMQRAILAAVFTGLGDVAPPRPRRRSGWLTTSTISWPAACTARNGATATAGVPR